MIYREIYDTIKRLITEDVDLNDLLELYDGEDSDPNFKKALTVNALNMNVSLNDIVRITRVTGKRIHCIICELSDEFVSDFLVQSQVIDNRTSFVSLSSLIFEDDNYTVIYSERLNNMDRINRDLICTIYNIMVNEYMLYIDSSYNEMISIDQDFSALTARYSMVYIPTGLCNELGIYVSVNDKAYEQFVEYINRFYSDENTKDKWVDDLFTFGGINDVYGEEFNEVLFLTEKEEDDSYDE